MKTVWKLQDAKSQFSKVVEDALAIGPQQITRRGVETVVVLSHRDYQQLTSNKPPFNQFLLSSPKMPSDFEIERQKDFPREMEL
jgi:antitoxin Phd